MRIISYARSLLAMFLFPWTVLLLGPLSILCHYILHNRKIDDFFMQLWAKSCCYLFGVKVILEGKENIPQVGCLFLFNHSSFFDIFALASQIPGIRFGAKAELFKIPVFSHAMRAFNTLPIARQNREEVYKIYEEAKVRFTHGEQFALAPEGGRFYGDKLSPFKAGPFVFAISAHAPVVPVVIIGAYEVWPKGTLLANKDRLSRTIYVKLLKPIETVPYNQEMRKELQQQVYEQMNSVWLKENSL